MSKTLQDFAPLSVILAIEANTIESFLTWTKWDRLELHQNADEIWIAADIPYFLFNVTLQPGNASAKLDSVIDTAISRAKSRKVPMGWWVGPSNPFLNIGQRLEAKGFSHAATLTGMAVDLQTLGEIASKPSGFTISEVKDADALVTWCQIMTEVSEFPDFAQSAWLEMYQNIGIIDDPQSRLYLGSHNGTDVSTSQLFLGAGVAGIHAVTTIPGFRGRGFGHAMTHSPLLDARSQGYRVGVLFSSEMAVNIYRRLGFEEYGRGEIFLWQLPEKESTLES